jgi:hypothetical protein
MSDQQQWPSAPPPPAGGGYGLVEEVLPELEVAGPEAQRRWTILLRWLLAIPQFIVLFFLSIAAFFATIVGWFGALFTGWLPAGIGDFLAKFVAYQTRVYGYEMLLVDEYPPFAFSAVRGYPIQIEVQRTPLNRLAVLFRIFLLIPAAIVQSVLLAGWHTLCFFIWLIALVMGRMPDALWSATAAVLRFQMRFQAYVTMLTPAYPWHKMFGDEPLPAGQGVRGTRPLRLGVAAKVLLVVFIVVGVFADGWWNSSDSGGNWNNDSLRAPAAVTQVTQATQTTQGTRFG